MTDLRQEQQQEKPARKPPVRLSRTEKLVAERESAREQLSKMFARKTAAERVVSDLALKIANAQKELRQLEVATGYEEPRGVPVTDRGY